jgi:YcaO-like protein with predicted kinase domain
MNTSVSHEGGGRFNHLGRRLKVTESAWPLERILSDLGKHTDLASLGLVSAFPADTQIDRCICGHPSARESTFFVLTDLLEDEWLILKSALSSHFPRSTFTAETLNERPQKIPDVVLFLPKFEPLDPQTALEECGFACPVVWSGETELGSHIGPVFNDPNDVEQYRLSGDSWSQYSKLRRMGVTCLPTSLLSSSELMSSVGCAIDEVLTSQSGTCVVLESFKKVRTWTSLQRHRSPDVESLMWPRGIVKNLTVQPLPESPTAYISWCWTPNNGSSFYECNSGKGFDDAGARISAVGEAVERFVAFRANTLQPAHRNQSVTTYRLEDFHPLPSMPMAEAEPLGGFTLARDHFSGESVNVPLSLVPFPLLPERFGKSGAISTGLAAGKDRASAVLAGVLEIIEAADFYSGFLALSKDFSVIDLLPAGASPFEVTLRSLHQNKIKITFLRYDRSYPLPIVHAFLIDEKRTIATRGSGSGSTLWAAMQRALLEALQIHRQQIGLQARGGVDPAVFGMAYYNWRQPVVLNEIRQYLSSAARCESPVHEEHSLESEIVHWLDLNATRLLVVDLQSEISDWTVVRVLVPYVPIHSLPSGTTAGKQVADPAFQHGVPI